MSTLDQWSRRLTQLLAAIGAAAVAGMIALTVGNIGLRILWKPIKGSVELIGFLGAVAAAFALGYAQVHRSHIAVDILTQRFSKRTRAGLEGLNRILGAAFFLVAGWQLVRYGTTLWRTGELTETLRIAYHPVVFAVALGCAVMALVLVVEVLRMLGSGGEAR
jgi:TRAP-type C4-dicarboxylate transport system permease small subunit